MIRDGRHLGDKSFFPQNARADAAGDVLGGVPRAALPAGPVAGADRGRTRTSTPRTSPRPDRARRAPGADRHPAGRASAAPGSRWRNATRGRRSRSGARSRGTQEARLAAMREALGLPDFGAAHRVLRRQPHPGRGDGRLLRGLRPVRGCARANTGATTCRDPAGRRLCGDARRARPALREGGAGRGSGAGPDPDRRRQGPGARARGVLAELGFADVDLVGVAKGAERKPGLEQLILPGRRPGARGSTRTTPACTSSSRFATRRTGSRSPDTGSAARRRASPRRSRVDRRDRCEAPAASCSSGFGGLKGRGRRERRGPPQVEGISRTLAERIYRELH